MELKLEAVLSSSIKRKKPWPRFCWLGKEKESVFLLDDKRISEINMVSGRTKKRTPKLHPLLNSVVTMASSHNGMWLCGLLVSGELFLWNKDKDLLKTVPAVPEVVHMITVIQGNASRLSLQVSMDGMRVVLVAITGQVFLWECGDVRDLTGVRDGTVRGHWSHIQPLEDTVLPSSHDKEVAQNSIFVKTEVVGDACLSAFVFTSGKKLVITCLKIQWEEVHVRMGSVRYSIQWASKTYPMSQLNPPCQPVKSRGALVPAFSPDGQLLAIVLNQRQPKATQVLFVSTQNFVSVSSALGGCGSKKLEIPSKYIRSYWVGSVSWSPGGLFLACVLKRGSLLMVSRLGGLLTLTSCGCSVDFGPAHFLPLHPLVTYRPPVSAGKADASLSSSSLSVRDVLRQRYSVTWHPRLLYLIVSDGYMATVMRVLDKSSPALLLKTLLKDTSMDLEKASRVLDKSQIPMRDWLDSVSCLNLDSNLEVCNPVVVPTGPRSTGSFLSAATDRSTLPLFLQDQGTLGGTKELLEKVQTFFEEDSDVDGMFAGSHVEDGGRLEFASMFDTLHARDTQADTGFISSPDHEKASVESERKTPLLHRDLGKIQSKLLTAWALGMSLGSAVENRASLLKHSLYCVVRFVALLRLLPSGKKDTSFSSRLLQLLKALLSFLPWDGADSDGPRCLGLVVELSKRLIRLLLAPHPESHQAGQWELSSHTLSSALLLLKQVSDSLDHTYSLQQKAVWSSPEKESQPPQLCPTDVHRVLLLQEEKEKKSSSPHQGRPDPQRPSSRLLGVWQWVYNITQQYVEALGRFKDCDGWEQEQQQLSVIMSQIQTAVQTAGGRLEDGPALLSYPGERLFLCGSYLQSADIWRSQICEESAKRSGRTAFKETQLCLALLYSLLSRYHLREAQELGDHMARLLLHRARPPRDNMSCGTDSLPCPWLPVDLHSDAACAVVQSLGRFMASYFTNQPLYILPAHHVAVLPPLHLPHAPSVGRLVPLSQEEVSRAVRRQQLSEVWTVDYAQDLLLLGGLLPESVWLAYHLGDWKTAASLSLAYRNYCAEHFDFTWLRRRELHLPTDLQPESIFQVELECLLGNRSTDCREKVDVESFTDPLEGDDWDLLQVSVQEILKASVMAGVNVLSSPLSSLLDTAKDMCSSLPTLVPNGLYLPSPPLYCPQPSPNTQDPVGTMGQFAEVASRHKVSGVLQRLLLLLRSARCCHSAAQWYISHLRRARHLLHKIKRKYSYPRAPAEEEAFPEGLMKLVSRSGFFKRGPNKDGHLDPDTIHTIVCFRELCGLCWMLHVRDQLSISCRKYQAARQHAGDEQISDGSAVRSSCTEALRWACRFLPFSCFLNAEEILQDVLLSLVSELPPLSLVADTLVQAFPEEEESVRVPLREKYNSLMQRLRQCSILEEDKEDASELMMIAIQDKRRHRRKHLGRLRRHLGPPELHLWEKEEEEEDKGSKHGMSVLKQLSLGTTLSTSTLTDCGFPPVCSDGETADNASGAVSPEVHAKDGGKKAKKVRKHLKKSAVKIQSVIQEEERLPGEAKEKDHVSLPVVGTWEFELEDEEYLNFLELFLSYVLEKDSTDGVESGAELPLLKGFSAQLRERELHSLTFDVLTTIHRRQRDAGHAARKHPGSDAPVFRAGSCYKPVKQAATPEPPTPSQWSEAPVSRTGLSVSSLPGLRAGRQKGLFGLRQQSNAPSGQNTKAAGLFGSQASPTRSALPSVQPSESFILGSSTSVEAVMDLQQGLDPRLEAEFPELGRLLEWMVRWADRRVLQGHHHKKKKDRREGVGGEEGVVIRVKASAPAILTSLSMLQGRYIALLGDDRYTAHIQVPVSHLTVAPVLQPAVEGKLERESSVDTGYPGSANTPNTDVDHNLQPAEVSIDSPTDEPEELALPQTPQSEQSFDTQKRQCTAQPLFLHDLDVTPEKEGKSSSECCEVSSLVSNGNICTPEASLRLADLDVSEMESPEISSSAFLDVPTSQQASSHPEPERTPTVPPEACAEPPGSTGVSIPPVDPPRPQPPSQTAGAPPAESTAPGQPLLTQPMRQRLGEDLYRLVQNINYVSLMEVLGASFANLQLAQQSSALNMNSLQSHVPTSHAASSVPPPKASPVHTTIPVAPLPHTWAPGLGSNQPQVSQVSAGQSSGRISPVSGQNHTLRNGGPSVNYQEMQPLSVQALSPEIQLRESRKLIPHSLGLLATTNANNSVPELPNSHDGRQSDATPQFMGLKLLQLNPSPAPHQPAHHPPSRSLHTQTQSYQQRFKDIDHSASQTAEEEKRNGSPLFKRQPSFNYTHNPAQHKFQTSETSRGHTPAPMPGLRLLHFETTPQSNVTFPKIQLPSASVPPPVFMGPMGAAPMIKLLHIEPGPKMMLPAAAPSAQTSRLISVEELSSSAIGRQKAEEAGPRLLRVEPPADRATASPSVTTPSSSKRQKRREEKTGRDRRPEVTFRPNDSIILTEVPSDDPVTEEPAAAGEITEQRAAFPFVPGSVDALPTGQTLLDKAMSTAAELHAFASTCKRPPECHDAFTNTEPAHPPKLVDKAVSVCAAASSPKSAGSRNLLFGTHQGTHEAPEKNLDLNGRQFISVLDLEDRTSHQDLPASLSPEAPDVPAIRPSPPTSAQLHVLATSVITSAAAVAAAAADPQPVITTPEDHAGLPEEMHTLSHTEPSGGAETVDLPHLVEPPDSEVCQALKTQSSAPPRASSTAPTVRFLSHLSELDAQLAALQDIADYLEKDFSSSRMLVNTIEKLSPVLVPDVKTTTAVKKTVRLAVPQEARTPRMDASPEPNAAEEDEEDQEEEADRRLPPHLSTSRGHSAGAFHLHTPPRMRNPLAEPPEVSPILADENLGHSALSDTAEILDELVREGYLSLTELDLSTTQTAQHSSRQDEQRSSWMSQRRVLPEDERRELRIWMRRKQRERLAVYQKQRESLRQRERKPFSSSGAAKATSKKRAGMWRTREGKDKLVLLEQYNQRTREAWSLASDFNPSPAALRSSPRTGTSPVPLTARPISAPPPGASTRAHSAAADDKRSFKSGEVQLQRPWTAELQAGLSEDHRRRLGLHRPVTSLPRDRLSQVTRRGMVTDTKRRQAANQSEERQVGYLRKTGLSRSPSGGTAAGRGMLREQTRMKEREGVNVWEAPSGVNRLLRPEDSNMGLADLEEDDGAIAGVSGVDWLDNLSETNSSCLSKIDWAAIERLVAAEDD